MEKLSVVCSMTKQEKGMGYLWVDVTKYFALPGLKAIANTKVLCDVKQLFKQFLFLPWLCVSI